jgi:hypothetical protein
MIKQLFPVGSSKYNKMRIYLMRVKPSVGCELNLAHQCGRLMSCTRADPIIVLLPTALVTLHL